MKTYTISEKDWKLFRTKVPGWQEKYMERLNREYIELLLGEGAPSEKFWALEKRIHQDKKEKRGHAGDAQKRNGAESGQTSR